MLDRVISIIDSTQAQSLQGLKEFLRVPSVSAQPRHAPDMRRCAAWLADWLRGIGLQASIEPTEGHPIVLARTPALKDRPTVLVYGHYDVQPPEPLDQWVSPPFEPTVRNDDHGFPAVFARGAVDDKGQVWAHLQAIKAWSECGGAPVNLVLLIEGEEEIASDHLEAWVKAHRDQLRADVAVVSDSGQFARGLPAITYGLRGLVYAEVTLTGPSHDLHSGVYGGAVPNPANALCELLATLHTPDGRVSIPGFYDDVVGLTEAERAMWRGLPFDEEAFACEIGLDRAALMGEQGYTTLERRWARPTCDINGVTAGYQGPGAKTVIASQASAKVSMRLVPRQGAQKVRAAFEQAMRQRCPSGLRIEFAWHGAADGCLVPLDSPWTQAAARAVERGFGVKPVMIREGGSIPVVGMMGQMLGIDTLLVGFGLPDDRVHSPNEKFDLDALHKGTRTAAALYQELARLPRDIVQSPSM
jgi:acetylornithine deacetylase/succinyl-diaminopimelate desuccinylase-like protein